MIQETDPGLMRDALATSTLTHGLKAFGDRWTMEVLLGAFLGLHRFDEWQARAGVPRATLAERLRTLVAQDVLSPEQYQDHPPRYAYRLTSKGMALYPTALMSWDWERRWGDRKTDLPGRLHHQTCGHAFQPELVCRACGAPARMEDLRFRLSPNERLSAEREGAARAPRVRASGAGGMGIGLRVDRWTLMILCAVILGCHHFEALRRALDIAPSVLTRRLAAMVDSGLLQAHADRNDARRWIYRLTASSRGLFGYLVCFDTWSSEHHFREPSTIVVRHDRCGKRFLPRVACGHCHGALDPREVTYAGTAHRAVVPA